MKNFGITVLRVESRRLGVLESESLESNSEGAAHQVLRDWVSIQSHICVVNVEKNNEREDSRKCKLPGLFGIHTLGDVRYSMLVVCGRHDTS